MPNEFEKVMDSAIGNNPFTNCFLEDILVPSKGSFAEHKNNVYPVYFEIQISVEIPILSEHEKLINLKGKNLKLRKRPQVSNILFNDKLLNLLTEEDPILSPIVQAHEDKVDTIKANSTYLMMGR